MHARLCLADGMVFEGEAFGAEGTVLGEVVFNTAMTGYQEVLSDPSYAGQIVCFTAPEIGNYGVHPEDDESPVPRVRGVVVRHRTRRPSSWRAQGDLDGWLARHGIVGLMGIDTRHLVRHIRSAGAQMGVLDTTGQATERLVEEARAAPPMEGQDLVRGVTRQSVERLEPTGEGAVRARVVVVDYGVKGAIVEALRELGSAVEIVPAGLPAEAILERRPDGVLLSNGPGDPAAVRGATETVAQLIGRVPLFGICLGCQLLGLALGARTIKLPFGHHGANHPVLDLETGRVEVTSQNHGFALEEASLPEGVVVTHRSLNDGTVEGIAAPAQRAFGVQYHPEACPGPHDARHLFERFLRSLEGSQAPRAAS